MSTFLPEKLEVITEYGEETEEAPEEEGMPGEEKGGGSVPEEAPGGGSEGSEEFPELEEEFEEGPEV